MDQIIHIILSFTAGIFFMYFLSVIMALGHSVTVIRQAIYDCLIIMSANIQAAYESYEIKYHALEIAERDDKYIDFQRKVDKQQLDTMRKSIIRNFIVTVPPKYRYLVEFHDWDSAMLYLTKEIKRRQND